VINNIKMGYTTTATAAGTTTLTVSSNYRQFFTGTTTQTIVLPVTSTLVTGIAYEIENNSTGLLTVNSSGGNLVGTIPAGVCAHAVCIGTTLTTAADWDWDYISNTTITGTGSAVLGTSPTIATPTITGDATISGLTVGKGGGAVSTNTAVGASALTTNSTGAQNTAVGASALQATTASFNTAVGYQAMFKNTNGSQSVAVGRAALYENTTGTEHTAVGASALAVNTTGNYSSAFGNGALSANTTGSNNTALGHSALVSNTTASNNTAVGYQAGYSITGTGSSNTALGYQAGYAITTGQNNAALGASVMSTGTGVVGNGNLGVGPAALYALTSGSLNTAVGCSYGAGTAPLGNLTTGSYNISVGSGSLNANTIADNNTAVGYLAGSAVTTGGQNTCIGRESGKNITTGTNNTCIGYNNSLAAATNGASIIITAGGGDTGKGSSTGFISPGSGAMYQGNNTLSWTVTSDRRLKKNIVDNTEGLDIISQIRVRNFEYRTAEEVTDLPQDQAIKKQGVQLGVIAQELQQVCSDCVKEESTGVLSVNSDNLTWHMINAIKDLKALVDAQATEITALKAKVGI
jgi:hypothetical protein